MAEETIKIINRYPEKTAPADWQQLAVRSFFMLREYFGMDRQALTTEGDDREGECGLHETIP